MSQCPVCQAEYVESKVECCCVCHWEINPQSLFMGLIPEFSQKEKVKLDWAKKLWAASKLQQEQINQLQLHLQQAKLKELDLQSQLEQLNRERIQVQAQLEQANRQRTQFQSHVEQSTSTLLPVSQPADRQEFTFQWVTVNSQGQQIHS
ncbi:MAG: formylglycine-generating enzyme family protein, partial [Chroococcidiopsidaceae cyanobacterium CP_BM_ER_R8_30]|nr:formylglycine-generating enzyme family protein [Chroococcidiopsidaceae cyanobacterium CP_BM_ER_R8_30]